MKKTLKQILSLVLALILTFSVASFAFAADLTAEITKEDAEEIALEHLSFKNQSSIVYEDVYNYTEAYKVISTVVLETNKVVTFICFVSKDGDVLYRSADYLVSTVSPFNPLTQAEALDYAVEALGADPNKVVVLTKETVNYEGSLAYHFLFCENTFERNECYVDADTGSILDIKVTWPSNVVDRLVLMIRVFITRFNLFNFINR